MNQNISRKMTTKDKKKGHPDKEPDFNVQINEPRMLRKDILEAIREIIIFMQGYEKFRKIQEEKVALFTQLKSDVRVINSLVDEKLRKYVPKGKLRSLEQARPEAAPRGEEAPYEERYSRPAPSPSVSSRDVVPPSELDQLESQLKDIEGQLRNIN